MDEVEELPLAVQAKLLRAIQEKEVMRIGGNAVKTVDVRVITASNASFEELIKERKFRKDLYYRLNIMHLRIPGLNERKDDIRILAEFFLNSLTNGKKRMDHELIRYLEGLHWEGNVRELKNCMEYMSLLGGEVLTVDDIPDDLKDREDERNGSAVKNPPADLSGLTLSEKRIAGAIIDSLKLRSADKHLSLRSVIYRA